MLCHEDLARPLGSPPAGQVLEEFPAFQHSVTVFLVLYPLPSFPHFFKIGSPVSQANVTFLTLLPLSPECPITGMCVPPCLVSCRAGPAC